MNYLWVLQVGAHSINLEEAVLKAKTFHLINRNKYEEQRPLRFKVLKRDNVALLIEAFPTKWISS